MDSYQKIRDAFVSDCQSILGFSDKEPDPIPPSKSEEMKKWNNFVLDTQILSSNSNICHPLIYLVYQKLTKEKQIKQLFCNTCKLGLTPETAKYTKSSWNNYMPFCKGCILDAEIEGHINSIQDCKE